MVVVKRGFWFWFWFWLLNSELMLMECDSGLLSVRVVSHGFCMMGNPGYGLAVLYVLSQRFCWFLFLYG